MTSVGDGDGDAITLVFQGPVTIQTPGNIALARAALPGATVVLSTLDDHARAGAACGADVLVVSADPGELPPYKRGTPAPTNNVNRQIVTTRAGLHAVPTGYAAKLRTDCRLHSDAFLSIYREVATLEAHAHPRLLVSSYYTLHPEGIEAFQFHVSDWFMFGPTETLQEYWDAPPMSYADAGWFLQPRARDRSHHFARRYAARFAPEQHVAVHHARRLGYTTPDYLDHRAPDITSDYRRYLGTHFIVCQPAQVGISLPKYDRLARSNYQAFNCVDWSDWLDLAGAHSPALSQRFVQSPTALARQQRRNCDRSLAVRFVRRLDPMLPMMERMRLMPLLGFHLKRYRTANNAIGNQECSIS